MREYHLHNTVIGCARGFMMVNDEQEGYLDGSSN
jgi:hypothetical protein